MKKISDPALVSKINSLIVQLDQIQFASEGDVPLWLSIVGDSDLKQIIACTLLVPGPKPEIHLQQELISFLEFACQKRDQTSVKIYNDLITTQAEIIKVQISHDSEGPDYLVTYFFSDEQGQSHTYTKTFGYDGLHAAIAGWGQDDLNAHWAVGNKIECRYSRGNFDLHEIAQP